MQRRSLMLLLGGALIANPLAARAQQKAMRVIGYLGSSSASLEPHYVEAFRQKLRELGHVEGENLTIEYRWAEGQDDRLPELAAELVRLQPDVIVTTGTPGTLAAKQATSTIPIVMASVGDPVGRGFVASLARPGGNITGVSNLAVALTGKWLEYLKQIVPTLSQMAVLRNASNPTHALFWAEAQSAAARLGLQLRGVEVRTSDDVDGAFATIIRERSAALVVLPDPLLAGCLRGRIAELAMKNRLPAMYTFKEQAEAGGLLSYGPSLSVNYRHAATYVDKILKGAKPADLPVEQPTKFELVINLKTAKALGLTIPQSLLLRADEVIE